jgi:two-component system, cell cycle sensor histidine kinase and response regulator CckA
MLQQLRSWLDDMPSADPLARQQAALLRRVLLALIALAVLSLPITLSAPGRVALPPILSSLGALIAIAAVLSALALSRRGRLRLAVGITAGALLVALAMNLAVTGFTHSRGIMLAFALPIVLAGLLGSRRALLAISLATVGTIGSVAALEASGSPLVRLIPDPGYAPLGVLAAVLMVVMVLALVIDRYSVTLRETFAALQDANRRLQLELAERRRAEEALREREAFLSSVYEGAEMPIFVVDVGEDGEFRYVGSNPAHHRATGRGGERIAGLRPEDFLAPEFAARVRAAYEKAVRSGTPSIDEQVYAPSGAPNYWLRLLTPLRDSQGRVTRLVGTGIDITEQRRAIEALRESEERFQLITAHMSDLICLIDADQRFAYASPAFSALLGYDPLALVGTSAFAPVHPDDLGHVLERWGRLAHRPIVEATFRYRHATSGVWIWFETRGAPALWRGQPVAVVVGRDVTERRQLQAQLIQAQKMDGIGRLAGGVAHDFNNLLVAVDGYAQLAADELPAEHQIQADLSEIRRAAERATQLTRQLLAFARRQISDPQLMSLNELIAEMDRMLRRIIREDISLTTMLDPQLWTVRADAGQIEQAIVNLVVNARDAMPEGGALTIETRNVLLGEQYAHERGGPLPGEYVMVAVSDTGVGIEPSAMEHLFEPFFSTKAPGEGTGLGLATCYGIVKQHGGDIWAYSEAGYGSTFRFYLPRAAGAPALWHNHPVAAEPPRGSERILLVEDDTAVRELAARVLRGRGYTVLAAANGDDALRLATDAEQTPLDLLLTDVVMPVMGGRALAERIAERYPRIKVLYTSGYTEGGIVSQGRLDEGLAFLQKPFTPATLAQKVREVLDG